MATINFPNNRDQLNPPLPTGALQDGDTTNITADGVTITYIFKKPNAPNTDSWWKSAGRSNVATPLDKIEEGNTSAEVIDTASNGQFVVSTEGAARMKVTSDGTVKLNGSNIDTDPSIQLNPDGSSSFTGRMVVNRTAAGELLNLQQGDVSHYIFNSVSGAVTTQGLSIGTDLSSLPNDAKSFLGLNGSAVFNEGGAAVDFRVESDSNEHMLFVDGSANCVGIGTASPGTPLTVQANTSAESLRVLGRSSDNRADIQFHQNNASTFSGALSFQNDSANLFLASGSGELKLTAHQIVFRNENGAEKARIDSAGRLLVGTDSARQNGFVAALSQIETTTAAAGLSIIRNSNDSGQGRITFGKSRGTANGSSTVVQENDNLGLIEFTGGDGTDVNSKAASIIVQVDGTPGTDDMPGRLSFTTTAAGASIPTERVRITNNGTIRLFNSPGIDFSGIQNNAAGMTSETLDSYEEGTWTPVLSRINASGFTKTDGNKQGTYTKIGRVVTINVNYTTTAASGGTGGFIITGLPFMPSNSGVADNFAGVVTNVGNAAIDSESYQFAAFVPRNNARIELTEFHKTGATNVNARAFTGWKNNTSWTIQVTYFTDQ